MNVDTILQTKGTAVYTLGESHTLADAVALLNTHNVGAVVVVSSSGTVLGIVSERDIVRQLGKASPGTALTIPLGTVMTRDVIVARRTTSIAEVMEGMTRSRIRHMPVVESDRLAGIISIGDVVKLKIEEVEHEAEAMREYIAS